jgi:tRNA A-37 threonylcarbamoyl transferase component Bud32
MTLIGEEFRRRGCEAAQPQVKIEIVETVRLASQPIDRAHDALQSVANRIEEVRMRGRYRAPSLQ